MQVSSLTYEPRIEGTMGKCAAAVLDIIEEIVGHLKDTLAHNVLSGPVVWLAMFEPPTIGMTPRPELPIQGR